MGKFTYILANFFILAGWVLLLVATISSPIINRISMLDVDRAGDKSTFGVFGYCTSLDSDTCTGTHVGYDLSRVGGAIGGVLYSNTSADRATKGLILHPIACGLAFIAQIVALASVQFGFLFASFIVFLAFLVSLVCMVLNFAIFGIVRNHINSNVAGAPAHFGNATWLVLAATISLLIATLFTLFACCCGGDRKERKYGRKHQNYIDDGYVGNQPAMTQNGYVGNQPGMTQTTYAPQRKHWWSKR